MTKQMNNRTQPPLAPHGSAVQFGLKDFQNTQVGTHLDCRHGFARQVRNTEISLRLRHQRPVALAKSQTPPQLDQAIEPMVPDTTAVLPERRNTATGNCDVLFAQKTLYIWLARLVFLCVVNSPRLEDLLSWNYTKNRQKQNHPLHIIKTQKSTNSQTMLQKLTRVMKKWCNIIFSSGNTNEQTKETKRWKRDVYTEH